MTDNFGFKTMGYHFEKKCYVVHNSRKCESMRYGNLDNNFELHGWLRPQGVWRGPHGTRGPQGCPHFSLQPDLQNFGGRKEMNREPQNLQQQILYKSHVFRHLYDDYRSNEIYESVEK